MSRRVALTLQELAVDHVHTTLEPEDWQWQPSLKEALEGLTADTEESDRSGTIVLNRNRREGIAKAPLTSFLARLKEKSALTMLTARIATDRCGHSQAGKADSYSYTHRGKADVNASGQFCQ